MNCPACGSSGFRTLFQGTDRLYRTTDEMFSVVECSDCRLIRLHPQPPPDELPRYYPAQYWFSPRKTLAERLEEQYRRFVLRDHVSFVARAFRDANEIGTVLDVGCGGGLFLRIMAERGHRVAGLDFSLDAARTAWHVNGVPAVCASLAAAPIAPGSCAVVTMFHVLEHLHDPAAYIAAASTLLKRDGRLVVQVPNASSWQFRIFGSKWSGVDVPRHLIDFKESDVVALLEDCGFEVLRRKHFSLRDNPAGLATTLAPDLDPMARRVRGIRASVAKDVGYLALVAASVPFTALEAMCRAGSTIMLEARKKR